MKTNLPITQNECKFAEDARLVSTTDLKGIITYANPDFCKVSGFSLEELVGKSHNLVRHPDMPPLAFKEFWAALKQGKSWYGVVKNRCKNGDYYWVDAYATPIYQDNKIVGYQSVRTQPSNARKINAEAIYKKLNSGKNPAVKSQPIIHTQLLALALVSPLLSGLLTYFMPHYALLWLSLIPLVALTFTWFSLSPLRKLQKLSLKIINNPTAQKIFTKRRDETASSELAFYAYRAQTRTILGRLSNTLNVIGEVMNKLTTQITNNTESLNQQEQDLALIATAIHEMSASVREIDQNVTANSEHLNTSSQVFSNAYEDISSTANSIQTVCTELHETSDEVNKLSLASQEVDRIMQQIAGISEQTNLLALNAAIEAARAGDAGRGFAVVADEVRQLAALTHSSTEDTHTTLEQIRVTVRRVVDRMEQNELSIGASRTQILDTLQSFTDIEQTFSGISSREMQVATAVSQQRNVAEEIDQRITSINQQATTTLEGAKLASDALKELTTQSRELESTIRAFN
ncbi:methyl-accepting chemotaxis protein [Marinospirillum insulare]|uniref:Aerotaxis receptor Aer n=1 Tax=Marinospirillum insulare TaxID=217169 RepID=A0ABQ5ZYM6_9GAMM|nr:PAS domain-containing methyl-accepting chemotaxis protein [Marinospirillum insulare]GLR64183.1 aerotaxis receptor Aer [Marinospirillum insulare]